METHHATVGWMRLTPFRVRESLERYPLIRLRLGLFHFWYKVQVDTVLRFKVSYASAPRPETFPKPEHR